jgi:hypothetical protein
MIDIRLKADGVGKGWVKLITTILNLYNNSKHSITEVTPIQATNKNNELLVKFNLQNKANDARKYEPIPLENNVITDKKPDNFSGKKGTVSK